jgi:hypothetical protein
MAQAKTASKRGSTSNSKPRSTTKAKSASGKASASNRRPSSASSRSRSSSGRASGNTRKQAASKPVIAGLATGAVGLIGGAVLGTRLGRKPKKVLGIPVPGTGRGIDGLAKQVGKAGKQLKKTGKQVGELTNEVRAAREKAEEVGKVIS